MGNKNRVFMFFFYAETIYNLIARVLFLFLMMEKNENGELLLLFLVTGREGLRYCYLVCVTITQENSWN